VRQVVSLVFVVLVLAAAGPTSSVAAAPPGQVAPSFDCALAKSAIDQTICGDPKLAEADVTMARLYAAARTSAFGHGPSGELAAQRDWLKEREDCRILDRRIHKSREECLAGRYDARNQELAVAALFAKPALALETLRKLDPEATPLYEAIILYANGPAGWTWDKSPERLRMLKLLEPYADRFRTDADMSFGRDILADSGIKEADDALKSEDNFTEFLQISSAYLKSGPTPRPLPCAAIVRRPELLHAADAMFGSTLDNFILYPDCATTLPPLPQFNRLIKQIDETWPDCEGTIRFSVYRLFGQAENEARVASLSEIHRLLASPDGRQRDRMPRLKGVSPAQVERAIAELAAYYQTYQKAPPLDARHFARLKLHDIVASGHSCGDVGEG